VRSGVSSTGLVDKCEASKLEAGRTSAVGVAPTGEGEAALELPEAHGAAAAGLARHDRHVCVRCLLGERAAGDLGAAETPGTRRHARQVCE
jgi:hypothetical protein